MTRAEAIEVAWEAMHDAMLRTFRREPAPDGYAAFTAALRASGYAVVPVEPTQAMKQRVQQYGGDQAVAWALAAWPDMLAAAEDTP